MAKEITIRKGFDIRLEGAASRQITDLPVSDIIAIKPPDFPGIIPRLLVAPGDEVRAGQPLFYDKNLPDLRVTSPVSGEVADVVRGDKRRILEVRILVDKTDRRYLDFPAADPASLSRQDIIRHLLDSGCWPYIRQRPFSLLANPADTPRDIFVSCLDTAPLAPDLTFIIEQEMDAFKTGLTALGRLAEGRLHIGVGRHSPRSLEAFGNVHVFTGPHPAGNVGIQIHHVNPIRKGDVVWYVHPQDVIIMGRLFREGRYRPDRVVALTGSCVTTPQYYRVVTGQQLSALTEGRLKGLFTRLVQGNVLTGQTTTPADFLSFYTQQLTAIPEGNEPEFLGWLLPGFGKLSLSRTFFSWLKPGRTYALDTNTHGEERAFVMTGQYDRVLPMNIYPVYLLKAILAKDLERMEQLGIYEVAEEDFALCEFVCTSKIDVQRIIAEGLEYVRKEG